MIVAGGICLLLSVAATYVCFTQWQYLGVVLAMTGSISLFPCLLFLRVRSTEPAGLIGRILSTALFWLVACLVNWLLLPDSIWIGLTWMALTLGAYAFFEWRRYLQPLLS